MTLPPTIQLSQFVLDPESGVHFPPHTRPEFRYSDGEAVEQALLQLVTSAQDRSSGSEELKGLIRDWPTRYHLSPLRANLFRSLEVLKPGLRVLELGAGCGALTRYLGEQGLQVDAVEGSGLRARIARARCADLSQVKVFADNFFRLQLAPEYDVVTLIGVLEYAPLFFEGPFTARAQACAALLQKARQALRPGGCLLLAIENRLGIKYWTGCSEDHTRRQFDGIYAYPDEALAAPVTFSRQELRTLLDQNGFAHTEFYYPFPDYKLPSVLLRGADDNARKFDLHNWLRTPFEDYMLPREHRFQEHLLVRSLAQAGLLYELANSFLVVAAAEPIPLSPSAWVARKLSIDRRPTFRTMTTLWPEPAPRIEKQNLGPAAEPATGPLRQRAIEPLPWIPGELLSTAFHQALFQPDPLTGLAAALQKFHGSLLERFATGTQDPDGFPLVKGHAFDYLPWNILVNEQGWHYIDDEWEQQGPLGADLVLFRYVFYLIHEAYPYIRLREFTDNYARIGRELIQAIYPQYDEVRHARNLRLEAEVQTQVYGVPVVLRFPLEGQNPFLQPLRAMLLGMFPQHAHRIERLCAYPPEFYAKWYGRGLRAVHRLRQFKRWFSGSPRP